ncbi:MAG: M48 family metallopeptidase [Paracoccaceae bacterium]
MLRYLCALFLSTTLIACTELPAPDVSGPSTTGTNANSDVDELRGAGATQRAFVQVVQTMEPVAERECERRTRGVNCDFLIVVDDERGKPANAFQTLDEDGRPIIIFTLALLNDARNIDEIAFVMGHEAAHHIEGHIARGQQNAVAGAVFLGGLATATGGTVADVERAQQLGAALGARSYSKEFELEADALGTVITVRSGFSAVRGAQFFNRIPDPGDRFLGTHPPNAARLATVRRVAAGL